ncbi:hypothetical protein ACJMK2_023487 [Sinanodonta woodiana]|uniref:Vps72/YL1 C-terminal domain-containing protein n=1 Tax=Sinanodonta woodiana TaxID=1069815 RepID=A0ABD3T4Z6_SINWO
MASTGKNKKVTKNRSLSPASTLTPSKKKRSLTPSSVDNEASMDVEDSIDSSSVADIDKIQVFKDPNFVHPSLTHLPQHSSMLTIFPQAQGCRDKQHSNKGTSGNKRARVWKNLKQIIAAERALPWKPEDVAYGSIDGPPSFKPSMKYSDLSGLPAKYTDPQTKLRYSTAEEYSRISLMPSDVVTGCLALRKATVPV